MHRPGPVNHLEMENVEGVDSATGPIFAHDVWGEIDGVRRVRGV